MLTIKRSAGVTPEVNLRNPLHAGDKAGKLGIHHSFQTRGRRYQKSKAGVLVATQKELMPSIFLKKTRSYSSITYFK